VAISESGHRQRSASVQIRNVERQYGFVNGGDADSPNRIQREALTGKHSRNPWIHARVSFTTHMHTYAYVNAIYSDLCLRECVLRVGINQSVHWSGPQCPYHYMRRAPSRSISGISCIKRTASPQCRLFLDAHILTLPACHPLWNNGHPLTSAIATVWYAFTVYRTCGFISNYEIMLQVCKNLFKNKPLLILHKHQVYIFFILELS